MITYDPVSGLFFRDGQQVGFLDKNGYIRLKVKGKNVYGHHLAWFFATGHFPSCEIDHINGIRSDNRFGNLREATRSQNMSNRVLKNNTSGFKGVTYHRLSGKWQANISVNRKRKHLGLFKTKELAAEAYRDAATRYFGEYSRFE